MKRLFIAFSIVAALGILSPSFPILAQPGQIPHENPAMAKGSLDTAALLFSYRSIFDLATASQYHNAQDMLDELKHTAIPDELRYITDRYDNLCRQLLINLDKLESLLGEASTLLSDNRIDEGKQKLDNAKVILHDTRFLLVDIETATDTLGDKLGVFAVSTPSLIKQAYDRLGESLQRLSQLIDKLNQLRESLAEKSEAQTIKLIPTELSLSAAPKSVFVGDKITASGRLTAGVSPLSQRRLVPLLNRKPLPVISTGPDGSYKTDITIPYEYILNMTLNLEYVPSGDDLSIYLASESPPVLVNTIFHPTLLEVSAPETVHPGLPFTINGQISSTGGNINRTIKVKLDDIRLVEETTQGQFSLEVTPPPQVSTGDHTLSVDATPQGRYSGASQSITTSVSRLPIQADIRIPKLVIIPNPIKISGKIYRELDPVQDARISLNFRGSSSTVKTSTDGSFFASLEAPLDLSFIGSQEITATIEPVEPWYTLLEIKRQTFAINPLNTGLMLAILVSLGLLVYKRGRTSLREETAVLQPRLRELPAITPAPEPEHKLTGIIGRILSAYRSGLEAVEKITGIPLAPHLTLREFLETATPLSSTTFKPFAELTAIAEIVLYSTHRPNEDTATRAEYLVAAIEEELPSGTA